MMDSCGSAETSVVLGVTTSRWDKGFPDKSTTMRNTVLISLFSILEILNTGVPFFSGTGKTGFTEYYDLFVLVIHVMCSEPVTDMFLAHYIEFVQLLIICKIGRASCRERVCQYV